MSTDRGMKKWAPFSSLIEQQDYLKEMHYKKEKTEKPLMSSDTAEKINEILTHYEKGEVLKITYWYDGYQYTITKPIKSIDQYKRVLKFDNGTLPFKLIVDIDKL